MKEREVIYNLFNLLFLNLTHCELFISLNRNISCWLQNSLWFSVDPHTWSGDKFSTDWDKAWSNIKKQKKNKKGFFSQFSPNKYVTWDPRPSDYPLSEEVDPIKRTERSNLMLWTSPRFTLALAIVIVTFLLLYTILVPLKWLFSVVQGNKLGFILL